MEAKLLPNFKENEERGPQNWEIITLYGFLSLSLNCAQANPCRVTKWGALCDLRFWGFSEQGVGGGRAFGGVTEEMWVARRAYTPHLILVTY